MEQERFVKVYIGFSRKIEAKFVEFEALGKVHVVSCEKNDPDEKILEPIFKISSTAHIVSIYTDIVDIEYYENNHIKHVI